MRKTRSRRGGHTSRWGFAALAMILPFVAISPIAGAEEALDEGLVAEEPAPPDDALVVEEPAPELPPPVIATDKPDYAPGEQVALMGEGWQPFEPIHLFVNDDADQSWSYRADLEAFEDGSFEHVFKLPEHFIAVYTVVATGELSGEVSITFTDDIAYVAREYADTGTSLERPTTITIDRPAGGDVAGRLMMAQVTVRSSRSGVAVAEPTGSDWEGPWTSTTGLDSAGYVTQAIFYRVSGTSEPTSYQFGLSGGTISTTPVTGHRRAVGRILLYSGVDPAKPVQLAARSYNTGFSTALEALSVNITQPGQRVVLFYGARNNGTITPPPAPVIYSGAQWGLAASSSPSLPAGPRSAAADLVPASLGATGVQTATIVDDDRWVAQAWVLNPAPHTLTINRVGTGGGSVAYSYPALAGVYAAGGDACTATKCEYPIPHGAEVTLTPVDGANSAFKAWAGDGTGSPVRKVTLDANRTATATFDLVPRDLTIAFDGKGSGSVAIDHAGLSSPITCASTCTHSFPHGTVVTLTPTAGTNSTFLVWFGDGQNLSPPKRMVTLDANRSATARFALNVPTSLLYTGGQVVNVGENLPLTAVLSSSQAACKSKDLPITFTIQDDPPGLYATATTDVNGIATVDPAVSTEGWLENVVTVKASFEGREVDGYLCGGSNDEATLTIASPGAAATGGGWYTLSGAGRVNFGFTVRQVPKSDPVQYRGQVLLINNGKWRLKGNLDAYSFTSTTRNGAASGTGLLYVYDADAMDYVLVKSGVKFTISFQDAVQGGKKAASTDTFGIKIEYKPTNGQPALPNAAPTALKGGNISAG
jgi:hypothetical protein